MVKGKFAQPLKFSKYYEHDFSSKIVPCSKTYSNVLFKIIWERLHVAVSDAFQALCPPRIKEMVLFKRISGIWLTKFQVSPNDKKYNMEKSLGKKAAEQRTWCDNGILMFYTFLKLQKLARI